MVYLPRAVGHTESTITVSTSMGDISYEVLADAVPSPNRLRPLVLGQVPQKLRLAQPVLFHNPYTHTVKV